MMKHRSNDVKLVDDLFQNVPQVTGNEISYLGRGAFGEVYQYEINNSRVAVKFITLRNEAQDKQQKIIEELKKEFDNNNELQQKINAIPELNCRDSYEKKINLSKLVLLTDHLGNKQYGFMSDIADYGDLRSLLFNLATASTEIKDDRLLRAFTSDPVGFLSVIAVRMRECLLALHELNCLHLDVAARNFLVYNVQYNQDGTLRNIDIKISDQGRAQQIRSRYDSAMLPKGGPLRYMDAHAIQMQKVTAKSDIYSFKVTLISMLGMLVGEHPNKILAFEEEDSISKEQEALNRFKNNRIQRSDTEALHLFAENVRHLAEKTKQFTLRSIHHSGYQEEYKIKYKLAEASLILLDRYASYFIQEMGSEGKDFIEHDNFIWGELSKEYKYSYQTNFERSEILSTQYEQDEGEDYSSVKEEQEVYASEAVDGDYAQEEYGMAEDKEEESRSKAIEAENQKDRSKLQQEKGRKEEDNDTPVVSNFANGFWQKSSTTENDNTEVYHIRKKTKLP